MPFRGPLTFGTKIASFRVDPDADPHALDFHADRKLDLASAEDGVLPGKAVRQILDYGRDYIRDVAFDRLEPHLGIHRAPAQVVKVDARQP